MEWIALKSGWLYERQSGVSALIGNKWIPHWVVVYGEPVPALGVYEQRSDASPPYAPLRHLNLPAGETEIKTSGRGEKDEITHNRPSNLLTWIRRLSVDTKASMADLTLKGSEKDKVFWVCRGNAKLCFRTKSKLERDQWVGVLKGVLLSQTIPSIATEPTSTVDASIPASVPAGSAMISRADARPRSNADETINCAGIVVLEGKIVSRLRTMGSDSLSGNPLQGVNNNEGGEATETDSIVGVLTDSCAIIEGVCEQDEIDEIHYKYQQAMSDRQKSDKPRDLLRLELQILKLVGKFHALVTKKLVRIIDEYHHHPQTAGRRFLETTFEDGALRLFFITDYGSADEDVIAAAYAWFRQELIASRWISTMAKSSGGLLQPLMTVAEYKGFRVLATIALPLVNQSNQMGATFSTSASAFLSNNNNTTSMMMTTTTTGTLVFNGETGLTSDEAVALKLKEVATRMNLLPVLPFRLTSDGRLVQVSLSPTLEVHKIETSSHKGQNHLKGRKTAKTPSGLYLVNVHDVMPAYPVSDEARGLLYFRPEFIASLNSPVAPGEGQSESRQSILKILRDERLPSLLDKLESLEEMPIDSEEWRRLLHEHGLNVALLGAIAQDTRLPHVREAAIIEMLARTTKLILRGRLRDAILHFREVQALRVEEELAAIALDTLNGVLSGNAQWMEELVGSVEDRFGYRISSDLLRTISRNSLLLALSHHCNLRLRGSAYAKNGPLRDDDFTGFSVGLANGGSGSYALTTNPQDDPLVDFAGIVLPLGDGLWSMEGRRARAAKHLLEVVAAKEGRGQWEEALKLVDLAAALCPRHHPNQMLIHLQTVTIKCQGPANLPWKTMVLGEKPTSTTLNREEVLFEELKRAKGTILHRLERHFGPHHPLAIRLRIQLASLLECWTGEGGKNMALILRQEALQMSQKILGRRHPYSQVLLSDYAEALRRAGQIEEAIGNYMEAIKLKQPNSADDQSNTNGRELVRGKKERAHLLFGLMQCWKEKGDLEEALEQAQQCRILLQTDSSLEGESEWPNRERMLECVLEEIAELCLGLYQQPTTTNGPKNDANTADSILSMARLGSTEILAEPIVKHLQTALECYGRLFEGRRNRHDLDSADGEALVRLARKIVFLSLRLATPSQRPVVMAVARRKLFAVPNITVSEEEGTNNSNINNNGEDGIRLKKEIAVKEWMVRMVAGPITPQEVVERILNKATMVDSLREAESELEVLLDLIEIVQ